MINALNLFILIIPKIPHFIFFFVFICNYVIYYFISDLNKMEANDRMLRLAGDFGKCQLMLIFLFSFINILSAWHYYSQTIISITPEHRLDDN